MMKIAGAVLLLSMSAPALAQPSDKPIELKASDLDIRGAALDESVRLETVTTVQRKGQQSTTQTVLILPSGDKLVLPELLTPLTRLDPYVAEKRELQKYVQAIFIAYIRLSIAGHREGLSLVEDGRFAQTARVVGDVTASEAPLLVELGYLNSNDPVKRSRAKRAAAVFYELTWKSARSTWDPYWDSFRRLKASKTEWGLHFPVRLDLQIGFKAGDKSVNITRNAPVVLWVGYSATNKRIVFRRGFRHEVMDGGIAVSVGLSNEFGFYLLNDNSTHRSRAEVNAKIWNPPSIPTVAFAGDYGENLWAIRLSFRVYNAGEYVPGNTLLNSTTDFKEKQVVYTGRELMGDIRRTMDNRFKDMRARYARGGLRCELLFRAI